MTPKLGHFLSFHQHPVLINDDVYDCLVDILQDGMPPVGKRTPLQKAARIKQHSLQRHYILTCGPYLNPVTKKEETRLFTDGRVALKQGDRDSFVNMYRYH